MEAAEALGRGNLSTHLAAVRHGLAARSRTFWIVAGFTALAAALRFATLGLQSYHHDEIVTATRILGKDFWGAMDAVGYSESAPPLYYALAWLWTQVTGTGEVGLRSLSALAGVATVPVAYLIGLELRGRATGIAAAALVAVNPMLLWYSQEGRAYALLILLSSLALLFFLRSLPSTRRDVPAITHPYGRITSGTSRDPLFWGLFSGLALATHYFALFAIALQALWLLLRRGREAIRGIAVVFAFGLLLAPLAYEQMSYGHAEWIAGHSLGHRLWEVGVTFMVGEIGDIIAQPERPLLGVFPVTVVLAALALLLWRGDGGERRAAARPLAVAGASVGLPLAIAIVLPSKDYLLARNVLPALVPMLGAVAVAVTLREARRTGTALAVALVGYSLAFSVWTNFSATLQKPHWEPVIERLGEADRPRAIVTWTIGQASVRYYLESGAFQVKPSDGYSWFVHEVDFISNGPAPPVPRRLLGPGFRQVSYEKAGHLYLRRYAMPGPELGRLALGPVREARLGFRTNGVLLDGIGLR